MKFFLQIKLIMWKNFTLRKRQKTRCIAEVVWPLFLFLILMWVRTRGLKEYIPECHFEQKAMPSVGPLPFLHSLVCSFNNTCHITTASASRGPNMTIVTQLLQDLERAAAVGEPAGGKDGFQTMSTDITALAQLLKNITIRTISVNSMLRGELLKHHIKQQNIQLNGEALNSLLNALVAVDNISSNQLGHEHYHLLCNATFLSQVIKNSTSDELGILANELCNISSQNLTNLLSLITSELDLAGTLKEADSLHSIEWRQLISILHKLSKNFITTDSYQNMINGVINFVDDYRKLTAESAHRNISSVYSSFLASQRLLCGQDMQTALNIVGGGEQFTRFQSVKELLKEIDKKSDVYINDTDASPECNDLFRKMETHYLTRFLWQQMKPFFRGKIVFAPNTPVVERVMERLNNNFEAVGRLKEIVDNWLNSTIPQVKDQLDTGASNALFIKNFTESQLGRQLLTWTLVPSEDVPGADILLQLVNRFMNDSNYRYEAYSALQELQSSISLFLECFEINKTEGYATEEDATVRGMELLLQNKLWAVVVFQDMKSDVLPPFVSYKIRTDSSRVDDTHQVEDRLRRPGPRRRPLIDLKYLTFGFAYLQDMVETSVIQEQTGTNHTPGIILQQFPYPCYIVDTFVLSISRTFPMFMTLSWVFTCSMIIKSVVYEKEHRLKETMRVMGLDNGTHWIGWFLDSLAPALFTIILLTIILVYGKVLERSDPSLVFVFLTVYCLATIPLSFLISIFFSRANLSAAAGGLIFFITYLPYPFMVLWEQHMTSTARIITSLFSNVAFGFGCSYFAAFEEMGTGVHWHNIAESPILNDTYSLLYVIYMLILDGVIYLLLMWYIESLYPGEYGVPKPLYFPFMKSYWCGTVNNQSTQNMGSLLDDTDVDEGCLEAEPSHLYAGVSLRQIGKVYNNGKVAICDLSLNFYQDQITAFLGHNGAGKTTTISILTGLYPPTTGTALINGLDIRHDMDSIRSSLGVCPQHNVLFDQMTVAEHLWFFARLKGKPEVEVQLDIQKMLADLGLSDKGQTLARELSGGMQRKLSIAAAFIGNSRTVILDEPTAGVDPFARRSIWELLMKYKCGRTVILTTHFMDEADLLGDRIAIIANGRLRCCGSSLYLKARYGSGYYLTVETVQTATGTTTSNGLQRNTVMADVEDANMHHNPNLLVPANTSSADVTERIKTLVPSARLLQQLGSELLFILPKRDNINVFCQLFDALDAEMSHLGIKSYGISDTTLEEIFLKVVENKAPNRDNVVSSSANKDQNVPVVELKGFGEDICSVQKVPSRQTNLKWQQFQALHIKHFHHTRRNPKGLFSELVVPAMFVCLALAFTTVLPKMSMPPPLVLEPWVYDSPNHVFFSIEQSMTSNYEHQLLGPVGMGTRCVLMHGKRSDKCHPVEVGNLIDNVTVPSESSPCSCVHGTQQCPTEAGGPLPPFATMSTGDIIHNMTSRNISDWLVKTNSQFYKKRYGGFTFGVSHPTHLVNFINLTSVPEKSQLQNALVEIWNNQDFFNNIKVWFNNKGWISSVSYMNAINNVILRNLLPAHLQDKRHLYGIQVINHPMNFTKAQMSDEIVQQSGISLLHAIAVIFAMSFIPASFVVFLIEERISKMKHLQLVSGVDRFIYWLAAFSWDLICYMLSSILCLFVFLIFGEEAYVSYPNILGLMLLLFFYGWATIPLMYPASFIFSIPSTAFVSLACGNLFIGIITTVATFVLEVFDDEELQFIASVIRQVFLVFPQFCLGQGLMNIAKYHFQTKAISAHIPGMELDVNLFEWSKLGKNYFCMLLAGVICFLVTLGIEYKIFHFKILKTEMLLEDAPSSNSDEDVLAERKRVLSGDTSHDLLVLKDLTKVYKTLPAAVHKLSMGVGKGQCFGLLGLNGAGKTSTFKMLTGDTSVTTGDALVGNCSIRTDLAGAWQQLGYCPQFDALDPLLSVYEHLLLYARLRGIPSAEQYQAVNSNLEKLGLGHSGKCLARTLSGGNKRKLSTAIALIGDPQLIFMDEPTTGMDPQARRFLWSCILSLVKDGRSVILTSHSMEECEALCTKLTIMVQGRFRCLGSCQHLKSKYGHGYILVIRSPADKLNLAIEHVSAHLSGVNIRERHLNQVKLELTSEHLALGEVFRCLEQARDHSLLQDYSVMQTNLEEVFLQFAMEESDNSKSYEAV